MKKTLAALLFTLALTAAASGPAIIGDPAFECRVPVFTSPDSVSQYYRIPGIVTLPSGRLVVVADRRLEKQNDLPNKIDVVARYSDDRGQTWSDAVTVVAHDDGGGYGDPALGVDKKTGDLVCVMTHGEGLWTAKEGSHAYINVCRSTDGGETWSKPVDITPGLYSQTAGKAPVKSVTAFATSGRILTADDGSMWFVLITRPGNEKWGNLSNYAVRSTDGGRTWKALPAEVDNDADESKIVELPGKKLLMSIRNRRQGYRKFARSTNRGRTWSAPVESTTLPDPAINGDIIQLADGRLLHSIADSHSERENVSLFISDDSGASWKKIAQICPSGSAYSALTLIDGNTIGVVTEENSSENWGYNLWFTRIDLDKIK